MVVARLIMWPRGDAKLAYPITTATLGLLGEAKDDNPLEGVTKGERAYSVRLFRDVAYGGPDGTESFEGAKVWRRGIVRGHKPGPRGAFDLLGGALKVLLGNRLDPYVAGMGPTSLTQPVYAPGAPPCCFPGPSAGPAERLYCLHNTFGTPPGLDSLGDPRPAWADLPVSEQARWGKLVTFLEAQGANL